MRTLVLLLSACLTAALGLPASAQTLETIRKTGTIKLGYIEAAAPFSFVSENGGPQGYSVDLCKAVADSIAGQLNRGDLKVQWVKLTVAGRLDAVRKKQVDLECSTTTRTLGRQRRVDFSLITFVDGGSVLARIDSNIRRLPDLAGKRVAVLRGTTTETALREALGRSQVIAELVLVGNRDEGLELLRAGKVDGLASDRTTLIGIAVQRASGDAYRLLDEDFSIEQYALAMPRGDADFRLAVDRALARLYRSGDIRRVYDRWLGALGPPSALLSATYFIQSLAD